jgi:hypothetical protein
MEERRSFASSCNRAYAVALNKAAPFIPSRAQLEEALQPIVNRLESMDRREAATWINATFRHVGCEGLVLQMWRIQRGDAFIATLSKSWESDHA